MLPESSREYAGWFIQDLTHRILPAWLQHAPRENGFFHTQLDNAWKPREEAVGTLVSQTRCIYTMSVGFALTGDEAYKTAAEKGIEFLEKHFRDDEVYGYFFSCDPDGKVLDDTKQSYGHSFVIFMYANVAQNLTNPEYAVKANAVWNEYKRGFADKSGGFYNVMSRGFEPNGEPLSQNPIMHLYEALLALGSIEGYDAILRDAGRVADFITGRLIDAKTGFLPELFTTSWMPARESDGNRVDVGHAFEWAYLLSYGVQLGLPKRFLSFAHQFIDAGLTLGFDRARGLVFSPASLNGEKTMRTNTYWEQCEALRAMLHFGAYRERSEMFGNFDILARFVREHYIDEEHGGWYTSVTPKGSPSNKDKGTVWKLDYHQTSMTLELARIINDLKS